MANQIQHTVTARKEKFRGTIHERCAVDATPFVWLAFSLIPLIFSLYLAYRDLILIKPSTTFADGKGEGVCYLSLGSDRKQVPFIISGSAGFLN